MKDAEQCRALFLFLPDHLDDDTPVGGIKRSGWLVEQQDRMIGDEAAGDVDALLFTT